MRTGYAVCIFTVLGLIGMAMGYFTTPFGYEFFYGAATGAFLTIPFIWISVISERRNRQWDAKHGIFYGRDVAPEIFPPLHKSVYRNSAGGLGKNP